MDLPQRRREKFININAISGEVVDSAIEVHRQMGSGLLERAYEACLKYELESRGLLVEQQVSIPVVYKSIDLGLGYRADLLVNKKLF